MFSFGLKPAPSETEGCGEDCSKYVDSEIGRRAKRFLAVLPGGETEPIAGRSSTDCYGVEPRDYIIIAGAAAIGAQLPVP